MQKHCSINPHSLPSVPHYLIRFCPKTRKFYHRETGKEIIVSPHYFYENYAGWFILTPTVLLVDGTPVDSSQIHCDPATCACFDRTTNQPVELQQNQVHFVVIDHQNPREIDYISQLIQKQMETNQGKPVSAKQVRKDFSNGPFYGIEYESHQRQSFNFDDLILSKVVIVPDGDTHFFYSMRSPTYNSFGSTILFKLV